MSLPAGAERRPSLSSSALGRGAAQLLTLSQVLPGVCRARARGLGGGAMPATPAAPATFLASRGRPGMAWFRAWVLLRDDWPGFRGQVGAAPGGHGRDS